MKNLVKMIILASALLAFGCGDETPTNDSDGQNTAKCGAKCDDARDESTPRPIDGLEFIQEEGINFSLKAGVVGEPLKSLSLEIEFLNDPTPGEEAEPGIFIVGEMLPSEDGLSYVPAMELQLVEFDTMTVLISGDVEGTEFKQLFTFKSGDTIGTEVDPEESSSDSEARGFDGLEFVQEEGINFSLRGTTSGETLEKVFIEVEFVSNTEEPSIFIVGEMVLSEDGLTYVPAMEMQLIEFETMVVTVSGDIDGTSFEQIFTFKPGDTVGTEIII